MIIVRTLCCLGLLLLIGPVRGDDEPAAERLQDMQVRADLLRLTLDPAATNVPLAEKPIFRFNDPARLTTDGTLWIWDHQSQPLVILSLFRELLTPVPPVASKQENVRYFHIYENDQFELVARNSRA